MGIDNFFSLLKVDLLKTKLSNIIISILLVMVCYILDSFDIFMLYIKNNYIEGNLDVYYFYFNSSLFSGIYRLYFLPVIAAIPYATSYCREYDKSIVLWTVSRSSKTNYTISKILINAFLSGICIMSGSVLFLTILQINLPFITEFNLHETAIQFPYANLLNSSRSFKYILNIAFRDFMLGSIWSTIAISVSSYSPDKYVTILSPFVIKFLYIKFMKMIKISNSYRIDYWLAGSNIVKSENVTMLMLFTITISVIILGCYVFYKKLNWRMENE